MFAIPALEKGSKSWPGTAWGPVEVLDDKWTVVQYLCEFPQQQRTAVSPALPDVCQVWLRSFWRVGFRLSLWRARNRMWWMWLTLVFDSSLLFCASVLKDSLKLSKCVKFCAPSVNLPRLLSCFSLSSCPLFYTISVSSLSVFFLVVSCSITLLPACKSVSALHSGLCQHLELSHLWNKAVGLKTRQPNLLKLCAK